MSLECVLVVVVLLLLRLLYVLVVEHPLCYCEAQFLPYYDANLLFTMKCIWFAL